MDPKFTRIFIGIYVNNMWLIKVQKSDIGTKFIFIENCFGQHEALPIQGLKKKERKWVNYDLMLL